MNMQTFKELMEMDTDELLNQLSTSIKENKPNHDAAVLMGSLGVSPSQMNLYFDSVNLISTSKEEV
ncbi:hypothetical protein D3C71_881570 [compost metagenome]